MSSERVSPVSCPTCKKAVPWLPESRYRPFCSQRCRLIDLGAWASEDYNVPDEGTEEDFGAGPSS